MDFEFLAGDFFFIGDKFCGESELKQDGEWEAARDARSVGATACFATRAASAPGTTPVCGFKGRREN